MTVLGLVDGEALIPKEYLTLAADGQAVADVMMICVHRGFSWTCGDGDEFEYLG